MDSAMRMDDVHEFMRKSALESIQQSGTSHGDN